MNKENLLKLAKFLETLPQEKFDIGKYRKCKGGYLAPFRDVDNCGSIGCSIGWAPFVKGLEPVSDDWNNDGTLSFGAYSRRIFNITHDEWSWCFSSEWKPVDNTPSGASERIYYLVKNGLPAYWKLQRDGYYKLCYK